MIKVVAPNMAQTAIDRAIQAHGAVGISQDTFLADAWMYARTIRFADGPDEVHRGLISKEELKKHGRNQALRRLPGLLPENFTG